MLRHEKGTVLLAISPRSLENIKSAQDFCRQNKLTQNNVKIMADDNTVQVVVHTAFNQIELEDYIFGG